MLFSYIPSLLAWTAVTAMSVATLRKHDGRGSFVATQWEMQAIFNEHQEPYGIFCLGYNITEMISAKTEVEIKNTQLSEISFIQSHAIRRPLANIMGISDLLSSIEVSPEASQLHKLLDVSAKELDAVTKEISNKRDRNSNHCPDGQTAA